MKTNNPGNINSQASKEAGLSYWDYMEKTFRCAYHFVWGTKKQTRKQQREFSAKVDSTMSRSTNPRMRFLSQMRNLLNGRSF